MLKLLLVTLTAAAQTYPDPTIDEARIEALLGRQPRVEARNQHPDVREQFQARAVATAAQAERIDLRRQFQFDELAQLLGRRVHLYADESTHFIGTMQSVGVEGITVMTGKPGESATFVLPRERFRYARRAPQ